MNDRAGTTRPGRDDGIAGSPIRRGLIAGFVGATTLALWFLIIDGLAGRPFHTPTFLSRVVLGGEIAALNGGQIVLYTVIHYAVFLAIGAGVGWLMDRLHAVPGILLGLVLGFLLFDLLFYGSVWFTGIDVVGYLGWPQVLVGNAIAGVALVGTIALLGPERNVTWAARLREHRTVREGLIVGLIGAVVVAAWFLVIDLVAGRLFFTPAALGSVVFHGATSEAAVHLDALTVLGYTGLHLAAFLITGLIAAAIVGYAEDRHAYVLLGAVLLFVTFETFFIGLISIAAQWLLELIPWWSIAVANLLAAAAMGWYLWTRHPLLSSALGDPGLERNVERDEPERQEPVSASPSASGTRPGGPGRR